MPVFINEVVVRASVRERPGAASGGAEAPSTETVDRSELIAEVMQAVLDQLERERDRIGER
jgi:hypothetical protein